MSKFHECIKNLITNFRKREKPDDFNPDRIIRSQAEDNQPIKDAIAHLKGINKKPKISPSKLEEKDRKKKDNQEISKLVGFTDEHIQILENKRKEIWEYFDDLKSYKANPDKKNSSMLNLTGYLKTKLLLKH